MSKRQSGIGVVLTARIARGRAPVALLALLLSCTVWGGAQSATSQGTALPPVTTTPPVPNGPPTAGGRAQGAVKRTTAPGESEDAVLASTAGVLLDRVVAVVNGEVVLDSDVEEERRLAAFQPITAPSGDFSREKAIERLINRRLLLQQAKLQPQPPVTEEEISTQIGELRREIPACKAEFHCETDAGWARFLAQHDMEINELRTRWRERMEALRFVEVRFRSGIRIPQTEIQSYYDKSMLPQYRKQGVKPPPLAAISSRIEEVLLQQQVSALLGDWLKSLRAQGTVQVVADGVKPS